MKTIKLRITGISPLLMNNPAKMGNRGGGGIKTKQIPTPEEEAEAGAYRDDDGDLYAPAIWFRKSFLNGGKGRRIGKMGAKTVASGALFLLQEKCPLVDPTTGEVLSEYKIDVQRCVIGKAGIMRARPRLDSWGTIIEFEYDDDFISEEVVLQLGDVGGRIVGVGDYRPEKGGPYGRYTVEATS